jgi:hypothetical protein
VNVVTRFRNQSVLGLRGLANRDSVWTKRIASALAFRAGTKDNHWASQAYARNPSGYCTRRSYRALQVMFGYRMLGLENNC